MRHTFGTLLAASGVHPKTAQELMRHSDINLTMGIYTHAQTEQVKAAIDNLPDFQKQAQIMTGTDDKPADAIGFETPEKNTPENTLVHSAKHGFDCLGLAKKTCDVVKSKTAEISSKTAILAENLGEKGKAAVGFEPTDNGFANRRLRPLGYAAEIVSLKHD